MTFPVVGSNIPSAYQISNSLRFNNDDSPKLIFTPSSAGNRRTFTLSVWFKLSVYSTGERVLLAADDGTGGNNNFDYIAINGNDKLFVYGYEGAENQQLISTQLFRDPSAWYHLVVAFDTTQSTASNRIKAYVNGNQITDFDTANYPSQNFQTRFNNNNEQRISSYPDQNTSYFDGYMAEFNLIDGQALSPTDFGEFDLDSGVWKPKQYAGTYGTNGFYLKFNNTGNMGEDSSGNDNTWTPTNLSGTTDVTSDTPTNNFATMNPLDSTSVTHSEGNLKAVIGTTLPRSTNSTISVSQGKWYCEIKITSVGFSAIGVVNATYNGRYYNASTNPTPYAFTDNVMYLYTGTKYVDGSSSAYGASFTTNDIIGIALNLDDDEITFYKNGSSQGTISKTFTGDYKIAFAHGGSSSSSTLELNAGNPSFSISSGNSDGNGYGNFEYAPPSGYLALCTQNLATALSPTIDDGSQYFNTVLYSGNNTAKSITGVGFQPDFIWNKNRSDVYNHYLNDSTRGVTKYLNSNNTGAEVTITQGITSFDSDGFTLGTDNSHNANATNLVAWNWKANGGTTSSNTDGSITSTVQANTTAGFSIVTYTGNGNASPQTVGHGLGKKCQTVILKTRSVSGESWRVYQDVVSASAGGNLFLNGTSALDTGDPARITATSSSTFTLTGYTSTYNAVNQSGSTYVAYCFADVEGYSKFGKYTGNGNADGTFVYTGFRPAFVIYKRTDSTNNWNMFDSKRDIDNQVGNVLYSNLIDAEGADAVHSSGNDFLSNGFKLRETGGAINASGGTYIYIAFAENPFVTSGATPVTAR